MIRKELRLGAAALEKADHYRVGEQLAFALVGATLGGAVLLVRLEAPVRAAIAFGVLALVSLVFEASSTGRYLRPHHAFLGSSRLGRSRASKTTFRHVARTAAALLVAQVARVAVVLACMLPGLGLAFVAHRRESAPLRALAENAGAFGACAGFLVTGLLVSFVSRAAAIEGLGPWAAVRRSILVARRSWMLTLLAELFAAASIVAVAIAERVPAGWLAAVIFRFMRDALLCYAMWAPPRAKRLASARAPIAAALVVVFVATQASPAHAQQVKLVSPNTTQNASPMPAPAATTAAAGVLVTTDNPVVEKPEALGVDVAQRKLFVEANVRLADAEDAAAEATKRLVEHRVKSLGNVSPVTAAEDARLLDEARKASALVAQRKADLYKAGDDVLATAYGGPYGTLQKNWIDFKNTGSYLLGMAESTPGGMVDTVKGVGHLAASAYNWITGPSSVAPAPDPDAERQARLLDREQQLQTELDRIHDGAAVNLTEGKWTGENVVGPLVLGEGAVAAGRTGLAVRGAVLARRDAAAAALVEKSAQRAAALERMNTEAIAGLPSVEGQLVKSADSLGQGNQYLPYKLADGRDALLYRGDPWELRDARVALDTMAKKQPGLMPQVYGSTRLESGEPALVLERFDAAQVAMNRSKGPFLEPYRGVFTPQAYEDWKVFGGFGRALDNDYVFLDAANRPRLALPRRASQFRELVESERIFQDRSTLIPP